MQDDWHGAHATDGPTGTAVRRRWCERGAPAPINEGEAMSEREYSNTDADAGALNPDETWGQGTDTSHPISALDPVSPDIPTSDSVEQRSDGPGEKRERTVSSEGNDREMPLT